MNDILYYTVFIFCLEHASVHYTVCSSTLLKNKKHLKNVGPIRHCEPPYADVHNDDDNDNA